MIKITKTTIEVNEFEFYNEVKRICLELESITPNQIGAKFSVFKQELGLKITELQFFKLCKECGIEIHPRKYISFSQFN